MHGTFDLGFLRNVDRGAADDLDIRQTSCCVAAHCSDICSDCSFRIVGVYLYSNIQQLDRVENGVLRSDASVADHCVSLFPSERMNQGGGLVQFLWMVIGLITAVAGAWLIPVSSRDTPGTFVILAILALIGTVLSSLNGSMQYFFAPLVAIWILYAGGFAIANDNEFGYTPSRD